MHERSGNHRGPRYPHPFSRFEDLPTHASSCPNVDIERKGNFYFTHRFSDLPDLKCFKSRNIGGMYEPYFPLSPLLLPRIMHVAVWLVNQLWNRGATKTNREVRYVDKWNPWAALHPRNQISPNRGFSIMRGSTSEPWIKLASMEIGNPSVELGILHGSRATHIYIHNLLQMLDYKIPNMACHAKG